MIIIVLGPPGSGKSTQSEKLSKVLGVPHISMGKVLREVQKAGTTLGTEANKYMEDGKLIPSKLIKALTIFRLEEKDCKGGFVLDGSPKRVTEAVLLDNYLKKKGEQVDKVISIEVPKDELMKRLLKRASLPKEAGGGREDDNKEDILVRMDEFFNFIDAIKMYYNQKDLVATINGVGSIEDIFRRIRAELQL